MKKRTTARRVSKSAPAPHSWDLEHWPEHVYPHNEGRARYMVRAHRNELFLAGAITRVGREIVFFGNFYTRWLESKRPTVPTFRNGAAQSKARVQA